MISSPQMRLFMKQYEFPIVFSHGRGQVNARTEDSKNEWSRNAITYPYIIPKRNRLPHFTVKAKKAYQCIEKHSSYPCDPYNGGNKGKNLHGIDAPFTWRRRQALACRKRGKKSGQRTVKGFFHKRFALHRIKRFAGNNGSNRTLITQSF